MESTVHMYFALSLSSTASSCQWWWLVNEPIETVTIIEVNDVVYVWQIWIDIEKDIVSYITDIALFTPQVGSLT